jgi:hypothetical protein
MENFKDVDSIVELGKWAYCKIPNGPDCNGCEILRPNKGFPYCDLRPSIGLIYDSTHIFKGDRCPNKKQKVI